MARGDGDEIFQSKRRLSSDNSRASVSSKDNLTTVPDLVSRSDKEVRRILKEAGLVLEGKEEKKNPSLILVALSQKPEAGAQVQRGSFVSVTEWDTLQTLRFPQNRHYNYLFKEENDKMEEAKSRAKQKRGDADQYPDKVLLTPPPPPPPIYWDDKPPYKDTEAFFYGETQSIDTSETKLWLKEGKLHREDGPAVIHEDGTEEWWVGGKPHREDGPARIVKYTEAFDTEGFEYLRSYPAPFRSRSARFYDHRIPSYYEHGTHLWFRDGKLHREGGPAVIHTDGTQEWYDQGRLHRTDGPARIYLDGTEEWWVDEKLHREDGPAVIHADGTEEWWVDGELHREDGPAVVFSDAQESEIFNERKNSFVHPGRSGTTSWTSAWQEKRQELFYEDPSQFREDWELALLTPHPDELMREAGGEAWYKKGKLHREDGPAIIQAGGTEEWRIDGELHRIGGPARILPDGTREWWVNGQLHREDGPAAIDSSGSKRWYVDGQEISFLERLKMKVKI